MHGLMSWTCTAVLLAVGVQPACAVDVVHAVEPGDTLDSLALRYWGEAALAESLGLYNGLDSPVLEPGATLRVPFAEEHVVQPGDSWASLADGEWKAPSRYRELALLSGRADVVLQPGERVLIPALIPHRLRERETFAALSRRVYRTPRYADSLARLNGVEDPRLVQVGQVVKLPLVRRVSDASEAPEPHGPSVPPELLPKLAAAEVEPDPEPTPSPTPAVVREPEPAPDVAAPPPTEYLEAIEIGVAAYDAGDFRFALDQLEALRSEVLELGTLYERELLLRHLTFLYTAYDRGEDACHAYTELERVAPESNWDPELISPKIIRTTKGC